MKVKVLREAGKEEALLGLSLSYNTEPSERVANRLAHKGGGESKFLESVAVWIDYTAPRYFHAQLDTYRVGITKQSESTMHTLLRSEVTQDNFEGEVFPGTISLINNYIYFAEHSSIEKSEALDIVKRNLPESFLQRRIVCTNYKTLQNMERQRRTHKLREWQYFLDEVLKGVEVPEWIKE